MPILCKWFECPNIASPIGVKALSHQGANSGLLHTQKHVIELHSSILNMLCQKQSYIKLTHYSSALFKSIEYLNVIEGLSLGT